MKNSLIKSRKDIAGIEKSGRILAATLHRVASCIAPGVSTRKLNEIAEKEIEAAGATASFKGYGEKRNPYPAALCVSVNDEIVHGIPSGTRILREGDIVGLDLGVIWSNTYFSDGAITVPVGKISEDAKRLMDTTKKALYEAIRAARPGNHIGDIGHAIQGVAESEGYSVVRDLIGHGVGFSVHEPPEVPCFGKKGRGPLLLAGMVLAIEPMVCAGDYHIKTDADGWTVRTADGSLSAHFEHTIAITENGNRILTG